jgi:hypothetical protein
MLNVEAYVGALAMKGTDLSLAEISQEVSMHTAQLAAMEEQLQGSVNLGLVQVNCNKVGAEHACTAPLKHAYVCQWDMPSTCEC